MAGILTLANLAADPGRYYLIDVRDAQDHAAAHVAGAVNIPLAQLAARLGEIAGDRIPVTICGKGGGRSAEGADLLIRLGRKGALALEGGTQGWLAYSKATDEGA
jgi:rhodanese-related sulfurtransferase